MGSDGRFRVDVRREDRWLVVVPRGELDIASVGEVRAVMDQRRPDENVRIDLSQLEFLDTSGLQLVVQMHKRARAEGFSLEVVRGTPNVQRVFEIAGLEGILPFSG